MPTDIFPIGFVAIGVIPIGFSPIGYVCAPSCLERVSFYNKTAPSQTFLPDFLNQHLNSGVF
jgi:hypothetical protein